MGVEGFGAEGEMREGLDQYSAICRNSRIIRDRANPSGGSWSRSEVLIIGVPSTKAHTHPNIVESILILLSEFYQSSSDEIGWSIPPTC